MDRRILCFIGVGALAWAATITAADAQNAAGTATAIPGITANPAPPPGFDPVAASPAVRARFGFPPAPDATAAPRAYAAWKRAVSSPQHREAPVLQETNVVHGPMRKAGAPAKLSANSVATSSLNWSGTSVIDGTFEVSQAIYGEFVVPTARQAFGACTGDWVYSSQWVGIDGNGSSDVLQAGVEADALCSGGTTGTNYYAWMEWFPRVSFRVNSPVIQPGDLVFIEVSSTSQTTANIYILDISTQVSASYTINAPRRTFLQSNSVEWIVERPEVGGQLADLTNYTDIPMPTGVAWNYTNPSPTFYSPGQDPVVGTLEVLTMLDNSGNPISTPTIENDNFLYFLDSGSACSTDGSC